MKEMIVIENKTEYKNEHTTFSKLAEKSLFLPLK
jgi:hypothetical protein